MPRYGTRRLLVDGIQLTIIFPDSILGKISDSFIVFENSDAILQLFDHFMNPVRKGIASPPLERERISSICGFPPMEDQYLDGTDVSIRDHPALRTRQIRGVEY